ncbi:hypothetical protein HUG10_02465 [Halorarum halophilum]|uniref:Uncharacterized protein n=1 Tax=Halorarum halophilum TaxID=2743090 RepID=A0A7D5GG26_9EURY|nr:hypothetical protein [Halobaculum halophilum]QLG26471.1 hypothetical protein HUG10_02465 [Halobaculum halophilum]
MRETREPENAAGVDRRFVLRTLGGSIALGSLATEVEGETDSDGDEEYAVVQDDECVPVVPLSGDRTVEELYDLRIPDRFVGDNGATDPGSGPYYQSNGTSDLQRENTTITFLYEGPDGLSLVVVHDRPEGTDGGSVSWTLEDVPSDAAWVVKDDLYIDPDTDDEVNFDQWSVDGSEHVVDWTWGSAGTDGGALGPLEDDFSIGLDPAFNEQSALWGEHYAEDPITDWQVLSFPDGREEPERTSLALDERVTIRAEACDEGDSAGKIADPDEGDEDRKDEDDHEKDEDDEKEDEDRKDRDSDRDEKEDDEKDGHEDEGEDTDEDEEEGVESDEKGEIEDEGEDEDDNDGKDDDEDEDDGEDTNEDEEEGGEKDDDEDGEEEEKDEEDNADEEEDEKDDDDDDDDDDEEDEDEEEEEEEEGDEDDEDDDEKERGRGNGRGNGRGDGGGGNGNGRGGGTGRGNDR